MLGSYAKNNRVKDIDWKEFVLGAMATTVCYPHQMHLGKTKRSKYTLFCLFFFTCFIRDLFGKRILDHNRFLFRFVLLMQSFSVL